LSATAAGVTIDAAWLAQHGPAPYVLGQANTTYTLAADVDTPGTAFVDAAPGVTLDLNGHTVTFGDAAPIAVTNGGFEQGSGRSVPGWVLAGAPTAALAPNTNLLFGSRVLRLTAFSSAQTVVSAPVAMPQANRTYEATITPAHAGGTNASCSTSLSLSVVDALTGQVLARGTSADVGRGFSATAHFLATTTDPVRLVVVAAPKPGSTDTIDLDAATLTQADDYGVLASAEWKSGVPGYANLPTAAGQVFQKAANFTIENGSVVQGRAQGYASPPLFAEYLAGLTVANVTTSADGLDTTSVDALCDTGRVTVLNSTFRDHITNVTDRMNNVATLKLTGVNGPLLVQGNRVLGSPQIGMLVGYNNPAYKVSILDNVISQNAVATNAYGILVSTMSHFEIAGNTIKTADGEGIDVDGYAAAPTTDGFIHDNDVEVSLTPNREYPTGLVARALRMRNNVDGTGPQRNLEVADNTFVATTGPGLVASAYAGWVS
jgi:hypothetical protein